MKKAIQAQLVIASNYRVQRFLFYSPTCPTGMSVLFGCHSSHSASFSSNNIKAAFGCIYFILRCFCLSLCAILCAPPREQTEAISMN